MIIEAESKTPEYTEMLKKLFLHRKEIKKPMTKNALEQTIKLLRTLDTDSERIECITLSIANGWQGVFPDRIRGKPNNKTLDKPSQRTLGNKDRWDEYFAKEDAKNAKG